VELLSNPSQRVEVEGAAHQQGCTNGCSKEGLITSNIQTPSAFDSDWVGAGFMIHGSSREVAEGFSCLSVLGAIRGPCGCLLYAFVDTVLFEVRNHDFAEGGAQARLP
jgi:hypothetical protein